MIKLLLGLVVFMVGSGVAVVLKEEYLLWGGWVENALTNLACHICPTRKDEWLAEMVATKKRLGKSVFVLPVLGFLFAALRIRLGDAFYRVVSGPICRYPKELAKCDLVLSFQPSSVEAISQIEINLSVSKGGPKESLVMVPGDWIGYSDLPPGSKALVTVVGGIDFPIYFENLATKGTDGLAEPKRRRSWGRRTPTVVLIKDIDA